jgi:hypothetical protein
VDVRARRFDKVMTAAQGLEDEDTVWHHARALQVDSTIVFESPLQLIFTFIAFLSLGSFLVQHEAFF